MANPQLWIDRIHPNDRHDVIAEATRCVEAGDPFKLEYRMLAKDGRVVWLHDVASVVPRDRARGSYRYQGVQLDITDRKQAEHTQRRSVDELRRLGRHRQHLLARLATTQETERLRIADGIHDETLQGLSEVMMRLGVFAGAHPEITRLEGYAALRESVSNAISSLRNLVFELHPRVLETDGLVAALRLHIDRWKMADAPELELVDRLTREPPSQARSALYRITQEALTNVRKHSRASRLTVELEERDDGVAIRIEDNGAGFEVDRAEASSPDHIGLASMRERAEAAGGWFRIESTPGAGTRVELWVPDTGGVRSGGEGEDPEATGSGAGSHEHEVSRPGEGGVADLNPREAQVAQLLALGHTNAEIAAILYLSVRTIEQYRARVFRKLGVRSRAALVQRLHDQPPPGPAADR